MTFIKDECGATTIEYGIVSSITAGLVVVFWISAFEKIAVAFNMLTEAITTI